MLVFQLIIAAISLYLGCFLLGALVLKLLFKDASKLLFAPFGFIVFQVIFWILSIALIYSHQSFSLLLIIVSIMLIAIFAVALKQFDIKQLRNWYYATSNPSKSILVVIILLGICHGILQIGFWNVDNSMSDNGFYVSIATAMASSKAMWTTNPGSGMEMGSIQATYMISTYETSIAYLAKISLLHPAIYMRIIMPVIMSLLSFQSILLLFRKILKKEKFALIGILAFILLLYYAPNYKSSLNDYSLEEWFLYYNHVGKSVLRYLVMPITFIIFIEIYEANTKRDSLGLNAVYSYMMLLAIVGIGYITLSPGGAVYFLALEAVFLLLLFFKKRTKKSDVMILGLSSITGFAGLLIAYMTTSLEKKSSMPIHELSKLRFLGYGSEYYNKELFQNFLLSGEFDGYWYLRFGQALFIALLLISGIIFGITFLKNKIIIRKKRQATVEFFWSDKKTLLFFSLGFPLLYVIFTHAPPIVEIVSEKLAVFGHQRLVGIYPYEIMGIALVIMGVNYFTVMCTSKCNIGIRPKLQAIVALSSACLLVICFIMLPARPFTYQYALESERHERLKFKDSYYDGRFDYMRLLENPYRLDNAATQITSVISPKSGKKVVAGTTNQFFGLTHVRNYDANIQVVRTRFSQYADAEYADASYLLRTYFSPWDNEHENITKTHTIKEVKEAITLFDVDYLVVLKNYKDQPNFGKDMEAKFIAVISETEETELFYIFTIKKDIPKIND
ncbi:hypothetical protein AwErysi_00200 [Erysipelotrichaceae bacterium]|nr:hypothetical protein AwErysi_00200 [Erysipelotrichaceae bacterium]